MIIRRRTWEKPRLTVLLRSSPEEAVLASCKVGQVYNVSNVDRWGGCYAEPYYPTPCANVCADLVAS